ncbi:VOC family protein [Caballeronia sp. LZ035]|uniref:VOC family protein n=1 Tax=Caballeronia sp. LZ035 TaxID=3038568 RepID=UPI002862267B|nr:VOC family protein [Caballeronia sp. LZ035]MDR5761698.1 VOC family protein [Caballeronia sp. LZ035]
MTDSHAPEPLHHDDEACVESLSAITLATGDMVRAVRFYEALGLRLLYGGGDATFSSFALGSSYLNLTSETHAPVHFWGRVIIHVSDVDAFYRRAKANGIEPQFEPRDAPWHERYFHLTDPDGHELSFARPL